MGDPQKYSQQTGVLSFRGGPLRQNAAYGTVEVEQEQLSMTRGIRTTTLGKNNTGYGYGSQPVIVKWYKNIREMMNIREDSKNTTAMKEVIIASNDGYVYFYDLDAQIASRSPIKTGFPTTAVPAVDPYGYPLLYVGQSENQVDNYVGIIGMRMYNLINQKLIAFETGLSDVTKSSSGAISSSPIVESDSKTLVYTGENGMLYTVSLNTQFDLENAEVSVDPQVVSYGYTTSVRNSKLGIRTSPAVYGDYAYFGDNTGLIQCVDMNTMQCVWAVDLQDSIMGTVALECEEDGVYLYAGNVLNRRGKSGPVHLAKIDALSGEILWQCESVKGKYSSKLGDGIYAGLMAAPLIGEGDISDLVIFNVNHAVAEDGTVCAVVYALDKETGEEVWNQQLDVDSVSSPIAVYQSDGKSYLILGDDNGTLRLMDGFTGTTISTVNLGSAIKASPAAYGNKIVVGTTGGMTYFVDLL